MPFSSPGDLPDPGIEPTSLALQGDSLLTELQGKPPIVPKEGSLRKISVQQDVINAQEATTLFEMELLISVLYILACVCADFLLSPLDNESLSDFPKCSLSTTPRSTTDVCQYRSPKGSPARRLAWGGHNLQDLKVV